MPLYSEDSCTSIDTIDEICELQYEKEQEIQKQKALAAAELQRRRSNSGFGKRLTRLLSFERSPSVEKKRNIEEEKPPKPGRILMNSLRKFTHSWSSEVEMRSFILNVLSRIEGSKSSFFEHFFVENFINLNSESSVFPCYSKLGIVYSEVSDYFIPMALIQVVNLIFSQNFLNFSKKRF